jgi:hypothetical protein
MNDLIVQRNDCAVNLADMREGGSRETSATLTMVGASDRQSASIKLDLTITH